MRRRLLILFLVALVPLMTLSAGMIWLNLRQQQAAMRADAIHRVAEIVERVDRELSIPIELLSMLAQSPTLDPALADGARFRDIADRWTRELPPWRVVTLSDASARPVMSTAVPEGRPIPPSGDPESVTRVITRGAPVVSPAVTYPADGDGPRVAIHVPVIRDGSIRQVITADIALHELLGPATPVIQREPDWRPFLVDGADRIVLSPLSPSAVGRMAGEHARAARAAGSRGVYEGRTAAGDPVITAFRKSSLTPWSAHVSIPLDLFNAPLRRMVGTFLVLGLATVGLTLALLWLVRRELSLQRQEAVARERLTRMEALGRMTGGVAHDFNNLLMVVLANADMLARRAGDERIRRHALAIQRAADKGAHLTRQLLSFSRGETSRNERIDLAERVKAMVGMIRQSLHGSISLELDIPERPCPVVLDPIQLDVAILNVAVNARDAMPEGGTLRIALRETALRGAAGGRAYALAFSDTGEGIPESALPHVFEPFFTTKDTGKGTGLGLAQVYGFARASGGSADIESRPGGGTTVTLTLPAAAGVVQPRITPEREGHEKAPPPAARILVVDDNPDIRDLTRDILVEAGYAVTTAEGPREALASLSTHAVDCLLTDIVMPGGQDGLSLARDVRARDAGLPIVLMSGYAPPAPAGAGLEFPLLAKPFQPIELREAVVRALDRRPAAAPLSS